MNKYFGLLQRANNKLVHLPVFFLEKLDREEGVGITKWVPLSFRITYIYVLLPLHLKDHYIICVSHLLNHSFTLHELAQSTYQIIWDVLFELRIY